MARVRLWKIYHGQNDLRLIEPTSGEVYFEGKDISKLSNKEMTKLRKDMQIIFQDPFSSLDPRMTVSQLIAEPLKYHPILKAKNKKELEKENEETVLELMRTVGLAERLYNAILMSWTADAARESELRDALRCSQADCMR